MDTSQLLARVIGPYMLIAGIGLMGSRTSYRQLIDELPNQKLLLMIVGAFTLIIGLLMLQFHNVWSMDWRVLVTLIGWSTMIKGAMSLLAPDAMIGFASRFTASETALNIQGVIALLFGAFMSYMGYFA